jgi:hypothetical protein
MSLGLSGSHARRANRMGSQSIDDRFMDLRSLPGSPHVSWFCPRMVWRPTLGYRGPSYDLYACGDTERALGPPPTHCRHSRHSKWGHTGELLSTSLLFRLSRNAVQPPPEPAAVDWATTCWVLSAISLPPAWDSKFGFGNVDVGDVHDLVLQEIRWVAELVRWQAPGTGGWRSRP